MNVEANRMLRWLSAALLGVALMGGGSTAIAQDRGDLALTGDATCTRCHDEGEAYPVLSIGKTRHGTVADGRTPTCTSCHGESPTHVTRPEGVAERPLPDINFKKGTATPAVERNQVCLTCHQGGERIHWQTSIHSARDVACTDCHQMHTQHDKVKDRVQQVDVCVACHTEQRAQINRPYRHPIKEGQVSCADCHNPHGSAGEKLMVRDTVNDTCYTCHMEKRGPFVHNHQPVTEDCSICHNPHGTNSANLLKARAPFLCQQCHNDDGHRSHPGVLPNARTTSTDALGAVGRGCLNCHTNIHGGNSTQDALTAGRFRR